MDKIKKGSDLRKEKWGSPSIQESKIAAKFSKRLFIRTVKPLRDISEKTWVQSYQLFFLKLTADQELVVDWIAGSIFILNWN